jgi:hypothetical protein
VRMLPKYLSVAGIVMDRENVPCEQ